MLPASWRCKCGLRDDPDFADFFQMADKMNVLHHRYFWETVELLEELLPDENPLIAVWGISEKAADVD